jgi:hypothetical protein
MRSSKPWSDVWVKMDANRRAAVAARPRRAAVRPLTSCCVGPSDRVGECLLQGGGDSAACVSVPHTRKVSGRRVARWSQPQKRMCALKEGPGGEEWRMNIYFFMKKPREESVLGSASLGRARSKRRTP